MSPPEQPEITTDLACMSSGSLDWLSDDRSSEPEFDLEGDSYWYVMIVDDDEEVHQASRFALRRFEVFGRSIRLLHARSTKEAMDLITMYDDIAVAMVDVVMETKDAGLQLVRWMRERQRGLTRIILRTGQPGDAPPLRVVRECDIDDYRTKSELDRERMLCCLTTAIRSYRELRRLDENRRGLKVIVESVAELWSQENLSLLSSGILTRIAAVLGVSPSGVVCVGPSDCEAEATGECFVISGIGRYRDVNRKLLSRIANRAVAEMRDRVGVGEVVHHGGMLAMRFCCRREQREFFVCLEVPGEVSSENLGLLQLFASNISALLHNVELLHRLDALAFEDLELGIGNRNALRLALTRVFEATEPCRIDLLTIEVDELEDLAATFGVDYANEVLSALAERLEEVPGALSVTRSSDHSLYLLANRAELDSEDVQRLAKRPVQVRDDSLALQTTCSVVAIDEETPADQLMQRATTARLAARSEARGGILRYSPRISEAVSERTQLRARLRDDLSRGVGVEVHLQPKVYLKDGRLCGAEALARWQVNGKDISPGKFIPIAESSGLAAELTLASLRKLGDWRRRAGAGAPNVAIAVNLSMSEIQQPGFAERLLAQARESDLPPALLEFEVTESQMVSRPDVVRDELGRLRDAGYRLALDDFGTGYSSLRYVQQLPIDTIKIDREFVSTLTMGNARGSIAASAIAMARSFGHEVVAEGVETEEQRRAVQSLGCEIAQGYLFAKAMPLAEFSARFAR